MLPKKNKPVDLDSVVEPESPTKTTRAINKLVVVALLAIGISLGVFLKWSFESSPPLVIKNSPFPTRSVPPNASASDVIILDLDYCKHTNKQALVRASYVSKTREIFMPEAREQYDKGCSREDIPVIIPDDLPADTYRLKLVATYDLNPIKKDVKITFESQEFKISEVNGSAVER